MRGQHTEMESRGGQQESKILVEGANAMGLQLGPQQIEQLSGFLDLLEHWGRVHNLVGRQKRAEQIPLHLFDSLAIAPFLNQGVVADLGSGAGLPGVPLAVLYPESEFDLIEPRQKRCAFLHQVVTELGLNNITITQKRGESYQPKLKFDTLVTRALAALPRLFQLAQPLLKPGGVLVAMKGGYPDSEIEALPLEVQERCRVSPIEVPGLQGQRHVAVITIS